MTRGIQYINHTPGCTTDGAYSEPPQESPLGGGDCVYNGAGERSGTYGLTAAKTGYVNAMQSGIVVTSNVCHLKGISVTLRMTH